MTYELYRYIFYGGIIATGIFLIVAIVLFFVFRIPEIIGDLSGATARRGIEDIRNKNENTGVKTYKSSPVNMERGKLTDRISATGSLMQSPHHDVGAMATEKISTQQLVSDETTILDTSNETTVLSMANETTLLTQEMLQGDNLQGNYFVIEQEITYIHTQEIIA